MIKSHLTHLTLTEGHPTLTGNGWIGFVQEELGAGAGSETQLLFQRLPPSWVLGLVILPAILLLAWLAYRRPSRRMRPVLTLLRVLLLAVAVLFILGPYLRESRTRSEPAPLALLVDDSASLQRRDALAADALARLAEAGIELGGEPQRLALARALVNGPWRTTLEQRYQVRLYRFAERLVPDSSGELALTGEGRSTAIGDALLALLAEHRGRRLPEIVLVSDGRNNQGAALEEAANRLAGEGVRVHAVSLGDPRPAPDLSLERIQAPEVVLEDDEALFLLRLRAAGAGLPERAAVRLSDASGRVLDQSEAAVETEGGTQVALSARFSSAGDYLLTAEVDPMPAETARDNNRLTFNLEVKKVQIRVLYVDGQPRYEYRFLKNRLLRNNRDVRLHVWLADAGRDFLQEHSQEQGLRPLRRVPTTVEELLQDFDVVILGDVDPNSLSADPMDGVRFLEAVEAFVERGGGLLLLAGPRHAPAVYFGSPLERLAPVLFSRESPLVNEPFHPRPPSRELPHPATLLDRDPELSYRVWENLSELLWYQPVEALRPGAQALLVHPRDANQHGPRVISAIAHYPEGWVGWIGTDETWRWRDPYEERFLARFWRSLLRSLAAARLRGAEGRARLDLDRSRVELGSSVLVEARLRDEGYQPLVREEGWTVFVEETATPILLAPVPGEPGRYRGNFRPSEPGTFRLILTGDGSADGEVLASARLNVIYPSAEMRITATDAAALQMLTQRTGGMLVAADRAGELLERLDGRERLTRTLASQDRPLDGWTAFSVFLVLAALEWFLRKRSNLS